MHTFEDDDDDASEDLFAIIFLTLGSGIGFLLINPFDGEPPKEELDPAKARLEGNE